MLRRRTRVGGLSLIATALLALAAIVAGGLAAAPRLAKAAPQSSASGPEVTYSIQHDVSPAVRDLPNLQQDAAITKERPLRIPHLDGSEHVADLVAQTSAPTPLAGTVTGGFAGVGNGDYGFTPNAAPPDTNLAVGSTQVVQWVNESFAVFNKSTHALLKGPVAGNSLWAGFGGSCQTNNDGDPIVQYDQVNGRWIFTQFSVSTTPFLQCVAVSKTSDATGTFNRYSFSYGNVQFIDYPKLGVWPDGYYITYNIFNNGQTFAGPKTCAWDGAAMRSGAATVKQVCFQLSTSFASILPADLDGTTNPPAGSPNFQLGLGANALHVFKFHVDFVNTANSTYTGPTNIAVAAFSQACGGGTCIPQSGTSQKLDSLGDRLMYRLAYRNRSGTQSLVVNHSITSGTHTGVRWYEVRVSSSGTPSLFQQGTFAPTTSFRWMGSIAMDKLGNIAMGYSVSSSTTHPSIAITGRVPTDPAGTMEAETVVKTGGGSQLTNLNRWGDYSAMQIDPSDDCTFWYTNEYLKANGTFNWSTWITSFKMPGC
jgi:hypothetical protein